MRDGAEVESQGLHGAEATSEGHQSRRTEKPCGSRAVYLEGDSQFDLAEEKHEQAFPSWKTAVCAQSDLCWERRADKGESGLQEAHCLFKRGKTPERDGIHFYRFPAVREGHATDSGVWRHCHCPENRVSEAMEGRIQDWRYRACQHKTLEQA